MAHPPGTYLIEDLHQDAQVILQPRPSSDPNDPLNWPTWRKNLNFGLVSLYVLLVYAMIDVVTVTWASMNLDLGFSYAILNDSYAAGCGALSLGGIFLLPFALKYGRRPVYMFSLIVQAAVSVWSAKQQNVADLMLVNILCCFVGALAEVMVQMTVVDVFFVHQRGRMNSFYVWTLTVGASLAPLAAGYITVGQGWRWVWWWLAILQGACALVFFFLYEETKWNGQTIVGIPRTTSIGEEAAPVVKAEDAKRDASKDPEVNDAIGVEAQHAATEVTIDPTIPVKSYRSKLALWSSSPGSLRSFVRHSYRPFLILINIPGVMYMAILNGAMASAVLIPITVYSIYMTLPPYNFSPEQIGLLGIPSFIGTMLGALICGPLSDWLILRLAKRNNGIYEPEMRLWLILVFTPFVAAGLLMFGIGLNDGLPWPVVCIGLGLSAFGTTPAISLSLTYLTDAYSEIISDSLVAVVFVKNLCPTALVFAMTPWINAMGLSNVFITATVVFVVVLLGNIIFIMFGRRFRINSAAKYRYYAEDLSKHE
ncbi:synaptic vesicle transporter [Exophiala viscosa]|uniref:Synaptic vesicle transporter n=1 Tax=Exophiala viscosa TaxID=2486360 RepID=A0AAN6ID26_9EURO|nr:synaptic vesicle transporter [Exophiala viscosa]